MYIFWFIIVIFSSSAFAQECPTSGTSEIIENPLKWSLDCFDKINFRTNLPSDLLIQQMNIDEDDFNELLVGSRHSNGNGSGGLYVFKLGDTISYLGAIGADISTLTRIPSAQGRLPRLRYYHHLSYDKGVIVILEYREGSFEHVSSQNVSRASDLERLCKLWPDLYDDCS